MKNQKLKSLLVLTLIFTLVISAPISVNAKTKKIGKPELLIMTYFNNSSDNTGNVQIYSSCKGAKKVEIQKASSKNGKYKKFITTTNYGKLGKASNGLTFYKGRGVSGSNKGKFGSIEVSYKTDIAVVGITENDIGDGSFCQLFKPDLPNSFSRRLRQIAVAS